MATVFKTFLNNDVVTARTLLHEAIPVTGSLVARTYQGPHSANSNIKNYPHGMFQSVYDYPYMSSSANHIFDLTVGLHADSSNYDAANDAWAKKKKNVYNQMAQVLVGHDKNGDILKFDQDGDFGTTNDKYSDALFINVARLIGKDEIRKGTFQIRFGIGECAGKFGDGSVPGTSETKEERVGGSWFKEESPMPFEIEKGTNNPRTFVTIQDLDAATDYRVNSPAGEYGILKITEVGWFDSAANPNPKYEHKTLAGNLLDYFDVPIYDNGGNVTGTAGAPDAARVGLIYYQAGVIVLDPKIFMRGTVTAGPQPANKTIVGTGWIPYTHDSSNIGDTDGNAAANALGGGAYVSNGHCDWLKDDRGQVMEPHNYKVGLADPTDAEWNAATPLVDIAYDNLADGTANAALMASVSSMDRVANGLRNRLWDIKFNNTTELNSTIYFCRINHNDFNYSSNPTYLGETDPTTGLATGNHSKIRVKRSQYDAPVSYITTVGLYSADNELLAVAKLSEPLKKDPQNEMILRVRLDY